MSRTYRKGGYLPKSLEREWEEQNKYSNCWSRHYFRGYNDFEAWKKYMIATSKKDGQMYNWNGKRSCSGGCKQNGNPTGWSDDLPKGKHSVQIANGRRRAWNKFVIETELKDYYDECFCEEDRLEKVA